MKKSELSNGGWISNFHASKIGEARYTVTIHQAGNYTLWLRANPVAAKLSFKIDGQQWRPIDLQASEQNSNIAADDKVDLRFIAWIQAGSIELAAGKHSIHFRMESENNNHGGLDCFVLANELFRPRGTLGPEQIAHQAAQAEAREKGWFSFSPPEDTFDADSVIDLRHLNERFAGENGFVAIKDGHFIHKNTGKPFRFWGVNGPSEQARDAESLRREARLLAKYGVNLVRIHGKVFDEDANIDPERVRHVLDVVDAMKTEGIYCHLSIYFPLWFDPKPDAPWIAGYNGRQHAFATLYFNEQFQQHYRNWWQVLLTTKSPSSGKPLVEEPALAGVELVNEDSLFFWTFDARNVPDRQLRILEEQFGTWLAGKYGNLDKAVETWKGQKTPRDDLSAGRMGFRPLWNLFNEKSARDRDTARFLFETQTNFYSETRKHIEKLGFKGVITTSNWTTASAEVLGPLEKLSYTVGDFVDRHGYFGSNNRGENSEWSIRDGHTFIHRSALKFDSEEASSGKNAGSGKQFVHPVMDPKYAGLPSMISETTWTRPNRYRGEAPLYYACYGALQDSDAIVHFSFDGSRWEVKPRFFMQPWTIMTPAMMGQFPAAALLYRQGLVDPGEVLAEVTLNKQELFELRGTPLPQGAAFDELRLKDVPKGKSLQPGNVIDPLIHFAGQTRVHFSDGPAAVKIADLTNFIDHKKRQVTSSHRQLRLDYNRGVLGINSPHAQGASGNINAIGEMPLGDFSISSDMELAHIVVVSLDGKPLAKSDRMLLQTMSEEKPSGFEAEETAEGTMRILGIGHDPWLVKQLEGTVRCLRGDAASLRVIALNEVGKPVKSLGNASKIELDPRTLYYLIAAQHLAPIFED